MPQMNKGGKWVFGWCVVGTNREIQIPPEAYAEYGFQSEELVIFLHGSRRSGGFSVGRLEKLARTTSPILRRSLGQGAIWGERQVIAPRIWTFSRENACWRYAAAGMRYFFSGMDQFSMKRSNILKLRYLLLPCSSSIVMIT